jgi:glutathione peroxidase
MIDRRTMIAGALAAAAVPLAARGQVSRITAYAFSFPALQSGDIRLAEYTGHPLLVVNTASQCGYTRNMRACSNCGASFMAVD